MDTPIYDFVQQYAAQKAVRMHMPGHKGQAFLGCESMDITEISGADSLYEASGIIQKSEENASSLFGTARTLYSAEGSSQCIRAMLCLALMHYKTHSPAARPVVVAARNAHKVFLLAAAMLDFDIVWLMPENDFSLCSCPVSTQQLEKTLSSLPKAPMAVYVTDPDYLGGTLDIKALSETAHAHGVPLLVDDAHGAYRRFLSSSRHPLDLGADICCDSAHKTLPVLTGGAYLQIARRAPELFKSEARRAMALFGSTSPSYLILQSLDLCNRYLSDHYTERLSRCIAQVNAVKQQLSKAQWHIKDSEELKLTVEASLSGYDGRELSALLEKKGIICEYADPDYLVLMITPENSDKDLLRLQNALLSIPVKSSVKKEKPAFSLPKRKCSVREAIFSARETLNTADALGRVSAMPTVACPPAVPIIVSGEIIDEKIIQLLLYYHMDTVDVMR